jgi:hypothetical protein
MNLVISASRHTSNTTAMRIAGQHIKSARLLDNDTFVVVDNGSPRFIRDVLNATYRRHNIRYLQNENWSNKDGWEFGAWRWGLQHLNTNNFINTFLLQDSVTPKKRLPRYRLYAPMCMSFPAWTERCRTQFCWHTRTHECIDLARKSPYMTSFRTGQIFSGCKGPNVAGNSEWIESLLHQILDLRVSTKTDEQCTERILGWYVGQTRIDMNAYFRKEFYGRT